MTDYAITESTSRILKNFASICSSVVLEEGVTQKTMSNSKSMLAIAKFEKPWPMQTPVFGLSELLANLSAYDKPTLTLGEKQFIIKGTNSPSHVEYPYSDPSVVMGVPTKEFAIDNPLATFVLPSSAVAEIKKFSAINNLPLISIIVNADDSTIFVKPLDDKNPSSRSYSYPVHSDANNITQMLSGVSQSFKFKKEHFDLVLDGAYTVSVGPWPYVYLEHQSEPISYIIVKKNE